MKNEDFFSPGPLQSPIKAAGRVALGSPLPQRHQHARDRSMAHDAKKKRLGSTRKDTTKKPKMNT
jgi:hypothetical protein